MTTDQDRLVANAPGTQATRGGIVLVGRFFVVAGLNYAFGLALAWILAPSAFGTVSVLQMTLWLAGMTVNSGFPWTLSWHVALRARGEESNVDPVFRTSVIGNLALGIVFAGALVVAQTTGAFRISDQGWTLTAIVAVTIPILALNAVGRGALHGSARFARLALVQVTEVLTKVLLGLALVVTLGLGAEAVALGFLAGAVLATVACVWFLRDLLPGRGPLARFEAYRSTLPMFVTAAGFGLLMSVDLLALRIIGTSAGVTSAMIARYQVGVMLAGLLYFTSDALVDAVFPFMVTRGRSSARSHAYLMSAFRWVALIVVPLHVVLVVNPAPIVGLLLPDRYLDAVPIVQLLALGSIGTIVTTMLGKTLQAVGRRGLAAAGVVLGVAAEIALVAILIPPHGVIGAAWASMTSAWLAAGTLVVAYRWALRPGVTSHQGLLRYALALTIVVAAALLAPDGLAGVLVLGAALLAYSVAIVKLRVTEASDLRRLAQIARSITRRPMADPPPVAMPALLVLEADGRGDGRPRPGVARSVSEGTRRGDAADRDVDTDRANTRSARWLAILVIATVGLSFLVARTNLARSPDTLYDEVVYTRAAQNTATDGTITWSGSPIFIHPPLYFLVQGAWLNLEGDAEGSVFDAITAVRESNVLFLASAVGVLVLLSLSLMRVASLRRKLLLGGAIALLAMFDPVLLRFGRLGMIEPMALLAGLLALGAGWWLRERSWRVYVPVVGLLGGIALLVKELTIVLIVVPLVFALLGRSWPMVRRSLSSLAVSLGIWLAFPAWAFALGLGDRFVEEKTLTLQRLIGTLQITGWNRPTVSFLDAIAISAGQYAASYVVLAVGGGLLLWLWLCRSDEVSRFLIAWLVCTYGFMVFTIVRGQLNEQFFVYIVPGAILATVLGADAAAAWLGRRARGLAEATSARAKRSHLRRPLRWKGPPKFVPWLLVALVIAGGLLNWSRLYAFGRDDGIRRMSAVVDRTVPRCSVINASGDLQKYLFTLRGQRIASYGSGPDALSHGIRYFFLNPKDVFARYGSMSPDLATWIRDHGTLVRDFPSHTYWHVQLWHVKTSRFDPAADIQPVVGGFFVNTKGSSCGGYRVVNAGDRTFFDGYQELGGKPVLGRPLSSAWWRGAVEYQLFDTLELQDGGPGSARPAPLVTALANDRPDLLLGAGLPLPDRSADPSVSTTRALVTDPWIAEIYLGTDPARADDETWAAALRRWGAPLAPASIMADGEVRQPFESVIIERRLGGGSARLAPIGHLAVEAGFVDRSARVPLAVPNIDLPPALHRPSRAAPFLVALAVALGVWLLLSAGMNVLGRRGPLSSAAAGPKSPPDARPSMLRTLVRRG
jgi:O-antigen/teichoic acid export membrane protein